MSGETLDVDGPELRALHRRHLRTVAGPMGAMALVVTLLGTGLALMPGVPRVAAIGVVALGLVQTLAAIALRHGVGPRLRRSR